MTALMIIGLLLTVAVLFALGIRDPKRIRSANRVQRATIAARPLSSGMRRLLGLVALAPGIVLAFANLWAAFMIWLGVLCVLGWVAAQVLAPRHLEPSSDRRPARERRRAAPVTPAV
jgi:hypothetical protein